MALLTAADWDIFLQKYPQAHVLQHSAWGELKSGFGWDVVRISNGQTGAQVLFRLLPLGLSIAYIPKGPVGPDWNALWPELDAVCKQKHAILLKLEPDAWEPLADEYQAFLKGFIPGAVPVQPQRTIVVSLEGDEEAWLGRMKQKTRYNIRLAERKEIVVKSSEDVQSFHALMQVTSSRDRFGVHSLEYYRQAYNFFKPGEKAVLLEASYAGKPLAALMAFAAGERSWYFYGASSDEERNRMPTYLLQWEAMRWAARQGCKDYDLWGVPDVGEDELEKSFESRSDGLWGVYRFKRGFGGSLMRSAGAWEKVYQPALYRLYQWYLTRRGGE
jgi:lipid II:glycine glycyltransferase (peptidoglycan interpeptide bridge formation enzyme)